MEKVIENASEEYIKNPPNNLNLADPSEQSRANDLIGNQNTLPVIPTRFYQLYRKTCTDSHALALQIADEQSAAEKARVKKIATELELKGNI